VFNSPDVRHAQTFLDNAKRSIVEKFFVLRGAGTAEGGGQRGRMPPLPAAHAALVVRGRTGSREMPFSARQFIIAFASKQCDTQTTNSRVPTIFWY